MFDLKNKTIIVTGSASGIGRAIVRESVKSGAEILAVDINLVGLQDLQKELGKENVKIFQVDVAKVEEIKGFFEKLRLENLEVDGLVNNAGIYLGKSVFDYKDEDIQKVLAVNLVAPIYFSQEFARDKFRQKKEGIIVNVASVSGQAGTCEVVYGATKAGISGLTKSCAMDFAPFIRVNEVAPGLTNTNLAKNIPNERLESHKNKELIKDFIEPEDIANSVLFLLSDLSKHCTGMTLDVNNGYYLR